MEKKCDICSLIKYVKPYDIFKSSEEKFSLNLCEECVEAIGYWIPYNTVVKLMGERIIKEIDELIIPKTLSDYIENCEYGNDIRRKYGPFHISGKVLEIILPHILKFPEFEGVKKVNILESYNDTCNFKLKSGVSNNLAEEIDIYQILTLDRIGEEDISTFIRVTERSFKNK